MSELLLPLPFAEWEPTKTTLHLWSQIVGKIQLSSTAHRNHWWNITLVPTARGLSTHRLRHGDRFFDIAFDFVAHEVVVRTSSADTARAFPLHDGLSVASFYRTLLEELRSLGIDAHIVARPYGVPMTTPFAQDEEHRSYDRTMVRRWFEIVSWTTDVFDDFASEFVGKQSPVHFFWHGFDLAMGRYSGRSAPGPKKADRVQQEAYSHEVIAFGFWPGDVNSPAPAFYTYTAPEPASLAAQPLVEGSGWYPSGAGHLGALPYDVVRSSGTPRDTLMHFLRAGYTAGTNAASWDAAPLRSNYT